MAKMMHIIFVASLCIGMIITARKESFRINNGIIDYNGHFPFMVRLFAERISTQGLHFSSVCGATLISNQFVLTAGHCVTGDPDEILMYFGANDTSIDSEPRRVEIRSPKENIILHKDYYFERRIHDIALVKLPEKVNFTDNIQPVRLASRSQTNLDNKRAVITGWGAVGSTYSNSDFIRYGVLVIAPDDICQYMYKKYYHPSNICIDGSHYSGCSGDSGGPALIEESDRLYTQVGIASTQYDCERNYPTSYTRITSYLEWIHENTGIPIRN